ncbi:MAG TPA: ABC transporter permease [Propionibacteriaceae bacterium]|nr:ABC transporter permease [Propionibacteriaceae bacterium]HPZ50346.1 ABC transporter permease [Propionibacteriaceae bacterium]
MTAGAGHVPGWIRLPAAVAVLFLLVPLVGVAVRVPWAQAPSLLATPEARDALWLSLVTCLAATGVSLVLGLPLAVALARSHGRLAGAIRTLVTIPMVLPPVVAGLALLITFGRRGVVGATLSAWGIEVGFTTVAVVIAQVFVSMPFLITSVEGALRAAGGAYEEVAATLGASPMYTLRRVTLPLMLPAVASGAALAFARALGEFGATITFAGSLQGTTRTLPLEIYQVRELDTDSALALSLVLILVAALTVGLSGWVSRRTVRRGAA